MLAPRGGEPEALAAASGVSQSIDDVWWERGHGHPPCSGSPKISSDNGAPVPVPHPHALPIGASSYSITRQAPGFLIAVPYRLAPGAVILSGDALGGRLG